MYFNECMNGFEYQVAGHMIWEGMVDEGLAVTRAIHDRYHATRRNPYNEVECGDHYARSMASHGVFLAACGFDVPRPEGHIGFAPRLTPEDFRRAFTAAEGWGTFSQRRNGRRADRNARREVGPGPAANPAVRGGGERPADEGDRHARRPAVARRLALDGRAATVTLDADTLIKTGQTLTTDLS